MSKNGQGETERSGEVSRGGETKRKPLAMLLPVVQLRLHGANHGIRTHDLQFTKLLLYRLS